MSIFAKLIKRREQRQKVRELSTFAHCFGTLEQLRRTGMIAWEPKERRLFIEQPLALIMMRDAQSWKNFIQNCYLWIYYRQSQQAWNDFMQREELAAVRKYAEKQKQAGAATRLTDADVERIRMARRQEILQSDMQPVKVQDFEFFIVTPPNLAKVESSSPVGQLIAVGHYDPETEQMEVELWEKVKSALQTTQKQ